MRAKLSTSVALLSAAFAAPAFAGGYDTPILYSAEHMGMGGAAIGYVDDPSAMFHNPAGLMGTKGLTLMANLSLITGNISAAPESNSGVVKSDPVTAVAPLLGLSYDYNDLLAFGLAFYPVASAGAEYNYQNQGNAIHNATSLNFFELTPGVAVKIPDTNLSLGVGYRMSFVSLGRQLRSADNYTFDVDMSGSNFEGYRVGLQWQPIKQLSLGFVYRSKTTTEIDTDSGIVMTAVGPTSTAFTLPAKMGFGARGQFANLGVVLDLEYGFYSQNRENSFDYVNQALLPVNNISRWQDNITLRGGVEYGVDDRYFFRGGFIYDGQVSHPNYPSAFGTPPTSTTTITGGFGVKCNDTWELNFAAAHRFGATTVDKDAGLDLCIPCSYNGDYSLSMTAFYVDFEWSFPNL